MELLSERITRDHILSGIDARIKLAVAAVVLAMVLTYRGFLFPVLTAVVCLVFCIRMKVPLRIFALRFSEPFFIAIMVVLIKFLFTGKDVIFSMDIFGLTLAAHRDGLMSGLMIAVRIIGAVSVVAVLGFATPFTELMAGLSWFRIPKGFIEILMFAYRYIFVLLEEAMVIYSAQKNRLGYSSIRRGLSSFGILTGSLTLKAFEHSQNTTVAMVQRGYDGNMPLFRHRPFRRFEVALSILFILAMGLVWKI